MKEKLKKYFKNEKGLTLVELLAVVVILGIIAAIAIPSIGALINNSKKDAQVANAEQMVSSAKLMLSSNVMPDDAAGAPITPAPDLSTEDVQYFLNQMVADGYIEAIENPFGGDIDTTTSYVQIEIDENGAATYSVKIAADKGYIDEIEISGISRDNVKVE